ncbi:MAG: DUF2075 domain-containing protein [Scytolyngbya sp. HA4215-MV1]|nr:DUF2075 domain-containing protein [Scytolyngbya sp. HA4215-MV1]
MKRAYYSKTITEFLEDSKSSILGELTLHHEFALEDLQRNSWLAQIDILKEQFSPLKDAYILFEYSIPRMGKRVDVVLILKGIVFVLEFKAGEKKHQSYAIDQVIDYALDLKNFHEQSHARKIVPVLVATEAPSVSNNLLPHQDLVFTPLKANKNNLYENIYWASSKLEDKEIDPINWVKSIYKPTPTIIEAAQALYKGHRVEKISRSDADAINLSKTSNTIFSIIEESKKKNQKSICFVTGVPGAGKTLAGLNIANQRHQIDTGEHAVFLSGNGPLVEVLQEALARDEVETAKNNGKELTKKAALSKTKAFIQNIHHFRDEALRINEAPVERVVVFDEAQRAWNLAQTSSFMRRKKGFSNFSMSEPEFLISVMDRHQDWAVIICLIGGGQEINTGEAGLFEWFSALQRKYKNWNIYVSNELSDEEYTRGQNIFSEIEETYLHIQDELHLSVSMRSYRSEKVSKLIKAILDCDILEVKNLYLQISNIYPILLTRSIQGARNWLRSKARGNERTGVITSSGAYRLKPIGIHVKAGIDPKNWFLNGKEDIRSSYFLEDVATEFDIQGLELDWTCVAWDANFRFTDGRWEYMDFRGSQWQRIKDETRKQYLKNSYRVLLTRARQGMVILIPEGDQEDNTRMPEFYNTTFQYLQNIGLQILE